VDIEGQPLPTLVYLAREKRPQYHHNFKAGAMNALVIKLSHTSYRSTCNITCLIHIHSHRFLVLIAICMFYGHNNNKTDKGVIADK
jgi:hypothetical protein